MENFRNYFEKVGVLQLEQIREEFNTLITN